MTEQFIAQSSKGYHHSPYFHVGKASDLQGKDRILYRFLEMVPGLLSWGTIIGTILLSIFAPVVAAIFIITFDLYWLLKTFYLTMHHFHNWKRLKFNLATDWQKKLDELENGTISAGGVGATGDEVASHEFAGHHNESDRVGHRHKSYKHLYHMIMLPFYTESDEVLETSLQSFADAKYDREKLILVLAGEARAGKEVRERALRLIEKYKDKFGLSIVTSHPADVPGEMAGKGSNIAYAAERARIEILDPKGINYKDVIVSAFDSDTTVYPQYFLCLTWHFLTAANPYSASFQPIPFYNNNIWHAPAFSRVAAGSSTFWQMIQQERPEQLVTFSSHAVSFYNLHQIGYWQKNMVSEDSRIFWNLYMAHDGNYEVVPISYPVSMDANLAPTTWQTLINIYKQHRRWMWGAENLPYVLFNFIKNKRIPLRKKLFVSLVQIEGFWSLATNPLMILLLGWLPVVLGGRAFSATVLSHNLPYITQNLMTIAMLGLLVTAYISIQILPPIPPEIKNRRWVMFKMIAQWVFVPVSIIIFGAFPGLEAQTRLMLGKYMGFWVTPKHRAEKEV